MGVVCIGVGRVRVLLNFLTFFYPKCDEGTLESFKHGCHDLI